MQPYNDDVALQNARDKELEEYEKNFDEEEQTVCGSDDYDEYIDTLEYCLWGIKKWKKK